MIMNASGKSFMASLARLVVKGFQLSYFETSRAGGNCDDDFVAFFFAHEAAADWRDGGNHTRGGIALFRRDQTISDFFVFRGVVQHESRSVSCLVARNARKID